MLNPFRSTIIYFSIFATALSAALLCAGDSPAVDRDRSPVDLVLAPDASWLITANQTSDSISLVRVADGKILQEITVGRRPVAIALSPDSQRVFVSCADAGVVSVFRVGHEQLEHVRDLNVGGLPYGVVVAPDQKTAYVALSGLDQIAVVDLELGTTSRTIDVARWPRYLALSPDGSRLAVGTSGDRGVSVIDPVKGEMLYVERFVGLNIGHLQASHDGKHVYFPWIVYRRNSITAGNIRLGWVLASRVARVRFDGPARREAISLDPPGKAVADPFGIALTSDEQRLVMSASGTHELLILRASDLPFKDNGGTDHIEPSLLADSDRFSRVELGGRPMGIRMAADDRTVFVANYLENAVQIVDIQKRELVRAIPLGSAKVQSLARRGEAIFLDGRRSLDQWYSCYSCHYDGGSNAVAMDTDNDGSAFTFKSVLPLYNVAETAPWTWHGWQKDIASAMRKSLTSTMLGPQPSDEDVEAIVAYLRTMTPPPNPHQTKDETAKPSVERGRKIFESDWAACSACHSGPQFTDGEIHDVGLGKPNDRYRGFNTPSLLGVWQKVTLLHEAQCSSIEEVLVGPHDPAKVSGTRSPTPDELRDLAAYLRSL